jgi:hypothetical protein
MRFPLEPAYAGMVIRPPPSSCYYLFIGPGIVEFQKLTPDLFLPRTRGTSPHPLLSRLWGRARGTGQSCKGVGATAAGAPTSPRASRPAQAWVGLLKLGSACSSLRRRFAADSPQIRRWPIIGTISDCRSGNGCDIRAKRGAQSSPAPWGIVEWCTNTRLLHHRNFSCGAREFAPR